MKNIYLGAILLSTLLAVSCEVQKEQQTEAENIEIEEPESQPLYYEFANFSKRYGDCKTDTSIYCTRVKLNYPEFHSGKREEVAGNINSVIRQTIVNLIFPDSSDNKTMEMYADRFIKDYQEVKAVFGDTPGWYTNLDGKVLRNDTLITTIELVSDVYTGGAHGIYNRQYLNFNYDDGRQIEFESLFEPGFELALNQIVEEKFNKQIELIGDESMSSEGFQFESGKYYNDENFAVLEEGIKFYYNNYEIASYANGPSEIFIKYDELDGLMKKKTMM